MKRFECPPDIKDDTKHGHDTKHVLNIFNMALEMYNSYIEIPSDYFELIYKFLSDDDNIYYTGDIINLSLVERYLLIKQCKKNYCREINIKLNIDRYICACFMYMTDTMFDVNGERMFYKLRKNANKKKLKQKFNKLKQEFNKLKEENIKITNKYKALKNHVLSQPDGELYFEAKKDWDSKTKNSE